MENENTLQPTQTEKTQTLAKCYALRATLSAISQEADKVKAMEREVRKRDKALLKETQQFLLERKKDLLKAKDLANSVGHCEGVLKKFRAWKEKMSSCMKKFIILVSLALLSLLYGIKTMIDLNKHNISESSIPTIKDIPLPIICIFIGILGLLTSLILFFSAHPFAYSIGEIIHIEERINIYIFEKRSEFKKILEKYAISEDEILFVLQKTEEAIPKLKDYCTYYTIFDFMHTLETDRHLNEIWLKQNETEIRASIEYRESVYREVFPHEYTTYQNLKDATLLQRTESGNYIEKIMVESTAQFSTLLDSRDWQHLDLIIFYYETGRADTIKEALYQVDRQRQTDSIVGAIRDAGKQISQSIREGLSTLRKGMIQSFSFLAQRIDAQTKSLQAAQAEAIQMQSGYLKELVSATNLQNALQEKANCNSAELMEDVHRMRALADEAYYAH